MTALKEPKRAKGNLPPFTAGGWFFSWLIRPLSFHL